MKLKKNLFVLIKSLFAFIALGAFTVGCTFAAALLLRCCTLAWRAGWKLFLVLMIGALAASAQATPVLFSSASFGLGVSNVRILVTADQTPYPPIAGTNNLTRLQFYLQPVNGQVITNLVPWGYTYQYEGWPRSVHIVVPNTTNIVSAASLVNTNAYSPVVLYSGTTFPLTVSNTTWYFDALGGYRFTNNVTGANGFLGFDGHFSFTDQSNNVVTFTTSGFSWNGNYLRAPVGFTGTFTNVAPNTTNVLTTTNYSCKITGTNGSFTYGIGPSITVRSNYIVSGSSIADGNYAWNGSYWIIAGSPFNPALNQNGTSWQITGTAGSPVCTSSLGTFTAPPDSPQPWTGSGWTGGGGVLPFTISSYTYTTNVLAHINTTTFTNGVCTTNIFQ
jgi:hypothetical protein